MPFSAVLIKINFATAINRKGSLEFQGVAEFSVLCCFMRIKGYNDFVNVSELKSNNEEYPLLIGDTCLN